ncbi:MAG: radical SAM protein [Elusimicrobia bacterium]|nr:radical SAM protein [Candidatus Liberimonas magnetica]
MLNQIDSLIREHIKIKLGINKQNEIRRLIFEICQRENILPQKIFEEKILQNIINDKNTGYLGKFLKIKGCLLGRRYPNAIKEKDFNVFLNIGFDKKGNSEKICNEKFYPEHIFIENAAKDSRLANNLVKLFPDIKTEYITSIKDYRKENILLKDNLRNRDFNSGEIASPSARNDTSLVIARSDATKQSNLRKRDIFVTAQSFDFAKACPCTKGVINCNYHIINLGFGCPFDCTYCYLQQYTNFPGIILNSNLDYFLDKVGSYLNKFKNKTVRIGTGEFTDSLALDNITEYSKALVPFFSDKNVLFELKTKSSNVKNLIGLKHNNKTVVSWSLNPEKIVQNEEFGTATLAERLKAAKICYNNGYKIGFHFDPVIYYDDWEKGYRETVNLMCDTVPDIEWISLGSFRFNRMLKPVIEQRFPHTKYIYDELVIGHDKKMRYYKALRIDIYKKIFAWIRKRNSKTAVYLCMEPKDVWEIIFGKEKPYWL